MSFSLDKWGTYSMLHKFITLNDIFKFFNGFKDKSKLNKLYDFVVV